MPSDRQRPNRSRKMRLAIFCIVANNLVSIGNAQTNIPIWPDLAPGETSRETGTLQPFRANESPPVSRVTNIRLPTMDVFLPNNPNGTAVLILPGGGFGKVVPDKEGSEAAPWLNRIGIATFVLRYRTNETTPADEPPWRRPLQDAQRALRVIHSRAADWKLDENRIGVIGFSAGGHVASILHGDCEPAYEAVDSVDQHSCRPDFSLLVYPWRVLDPKTQKLWPYIQFSKSTKPAFIVHTHDDASTSIGSVEIYSQLKRLGISAELHIYENGGHGYGMRSVEGSNISDWQAAANNWLIRRGLGTE
ncbi:MAG: alpha/beta hydrolase [Planctomycetales bacterium]|nr:alpha/beta hydrolase [Planctomycetales bacterium]